MSKRLLVIDGDDREAFFLSVDGGTMTLGGDPANVEAVLRGLHITRIHCEVEVEEDRVVVGNPDGVTGDGSFRQELQPGEIFQLGHSSLRLGGAAGPAPAAAPAAPKPAAAAAPPLTQTKRRLFVIDGADKGRFFPLPESGTVMIGKSHKSCDIVLHDLYVARVHCQLKVDDDLILVSHLEGDNGTLINGQRIKEQTLAMGDVLRVGNEHLRLEFFQAEEKKPGDDSEVGSGVSEEDAYDVAGDEEAVDLEVLEDDEEVVEVIEEDVEDAAEEVGQKAAAGGAFSLPHPPVDQLLKLEDQVLGHFRIGPLLGRGQSGVVFRALDSRNNQTVALKILSPDFPDSDAEL